MNGIFGPDGKLVADTGEVGLMAAHTIGAGASKIVDAFTTLGYPKPKFVAIVVDGGVAVVCCDDKTRTAVGKKLMAALTEPSDAKADAPKGKGKKTEETPKPPETPAAPKADAPKADALKDVAAAAGVSGNF